MKDLKGYLEIKQVARIINHCVNPRDKLLITLLANTGRRISEALLLKPKDIDFDNELIYWRVLKRKDITHKWIATKRSLLSCLDNYRDEFKIKDDQYYFWSSHREHKPINRHRVYQLITKAGKRVNITRVGDRPIHPHVFRHSFCVWSAREVSNAADLKLLQELMGHAKIETTAYYLQFAQKEAKELVNRLPDFMDLGLTDKEMTKRLMSDDVLKFNKEVGL